MISLIWAMDRNWLIGKGNILPWRYKKDLLYFKEKTANQTVLMGDMTYDSLKSYYKDRPLPFKEMFVASLTDRTFEGATKISDIDHFLKTNEKDLYVIGGKTIYKLALPYADRLYITWVDADHEGDVYFPSFDLSKFNLISESKEDVLRFCLYEKVMQ